MCGNLRFFLTFVIIYVSGNGKNEMVTAGMEAIMNRQSDKITALYCRLAKFNREIDNHIRKGQMEFLFRYAQDRGLPNPSFFCDWRFPGTDQRRPQYQRMLHMVRDGTVANVVVSNISRLTRDYETSIQLLETFFPRYDITLHSIQDNLVATSQDLREKAEQSRAMRSALLLWTGGMK